MPTRHAFKTDRLPAAAHRAQAKRYWHALLGASLGLTLLGLLAKLGYLALELYYNQALLEFVGLAQVSEAQARHLEASGHHLAALGATLVLLTVLYPLLYRAARRLRDRLAPALRRGAATARARWTTRALRVALFAGFAAIAYAGLYQAQAQLMEALVARASPAQRFEAYYLNILRHLLARGTIQHAGVLPARVEDAPPTLAFADKLVLAELAIAVFDDTGLLARLRREGHAAIEAYLKQRALAEKFPTHWAAYRAAQVRLEALWVRYRQALERVRQETGDVRQQGLDAYGEVVAALQRAYADYRRGFAQYERHILGQRLTAHNLAVLGEHLTRYYANPEDFATEYTHYTQATQAMFGYAPEPRRRYWCEGTRCPGSIEVVRTKAREIFHRQFLRQSGGVPPGLSEAQFYHHPAALAAATAALTEQGVALPAGWALQAASFVRAYEAAVYAAARARLNAEFTQATGHAFDFPLDLTAESFPRHAGLRAFLAPDLPEELHAIPLTLDQAGFFAQVWRPRVEREIRAGLAQHLPADPAQFATPAWEERGRDAVKALYVIPVALFFSALFSLLNTVLLLVSLAVLVAGGVVYGLARLRHRPPPMPQGAGPRAVQAGAVALAVSLALAPLALSRLDLAAGRPAVAHYLAAGGAQHPVYFAALAWLNRAEHLVHAGGQALRQLLPPALGHRLDIHFGLLRGAPSESP